MSKLFIKQEHGNTEKGFTENKLELQEAEKRFIGENGHNSHGS